MVLYILICTDCSLSWHTTLIKKVSSACHDLQLWMYVLGNIWIIDCSCLIACLQGHPFCFNRLNICINENLSKDKILTENCLEKDCSQYYITVQVALCKLRTIFKCLCWNSKWAVGSGEIAPEVVIKKMHNRHSILNIISWNYVKIYYCFFSVLPWIPTIAERGKWQEWTKTFKENGFHSISVLCPWSLWKFKSGQKSNQPNNVPLFFSLLC